MQRNTKHTDRPTYPSAGPLQLQRDAMKVIRNLSAFLPNFLHDIWFNIVQRRRFVGQVKRGNLVLPRKLQLNYLKLISDNRYRERRVGVSDVGYRDCDTLWLLLPHVVMRNNIIIVSRGVELVPLQRLKLPQRPIHLSWWKVINGESGRQGGSSCVLRSTAIWYTVFLSGPAQLMLGLVTGPRSLKSWVHILII